MKKFIFILFVASCNNAEVRTNNEIENNHVSHKKNEMQKDGIDTLFIKCDSITNALSILIKYDTNSVDSMFVENALRIIKKYKFIAKKL